MPVDHDMRMQLAFLADLNMFTDDAVRTDVATGPDFRIRVNNSSLMNHGTFLTFDEHEGHFGFADDRSVDGANSFSFADLAASLGQFHVDHERVSGADRIPPLNTFSGHEISDAALIFDLAEHENSRDLSDRLQLQ